MFRGKTIALWIGVSFFSLWGFIQPCIALDFTGILTHGTSMSPFAGLSNGTGGSSAFGSLLNSQVSPWSGTQSASSGNLLTGPFEDGSSPTSNGSPVFDNDSYFNGLNSVTHMSICPFTRPTETQETSTGSMVSPFGSVGVSSNYTDALGFHYNIGNVGNSGGSAAGSGSSTTSIQQIMSYFR